MASGSVEQIPENGVRAQVSRLAIGIPAGTAGVAESGSGRINT